LAGLADCWARLKGCSAARASQEYEVWSLPQLKTAIIV
jgi:hypothetical protein